MSLTRSIGQGNVYSKFNHDGTSIVKRFASRSLTGRGLQIKIHQHIGYRLHLLWNPTNDETARSMCIERVFLMYHEVSDFLEKLTSKAFEGMCDCACINVSEWFEDKVEPCYVPVTRYSQKPIGDCHRSCLRTFQETEKYKCYRCNCRVTSSHAVFLA